MGIIKTFERIGYLRAANEAERQGYVVLAHKLRKRAQDTE